MLSRILFGYFKIFLFKILRWYFKYFLSFKYELEEIFIIVKEVNVCFNKGMIFVWIYCGVLYIFWESRDF